MAAAEAVFARALPSEIKIEETYPYVARVRSVPQVMLPPADNGHAGAAPAQGSVEVRVPYDGQRFFGPRALRDVRRLLRSSRAGVDGDLQSRIGHLVITRYGRTKLAGSELLALDGVVALAVPVRGDAMQDVEDLRRGQKEARVRVAYEPERPGSPPLHVLLSVSDEEGLVEIQRELQAAEKAADLKATQRLRTELARQMGRKADFAPALRLTLDVQLELPPAVGLADDPNPPQLKLLWLQWPGVPSYRRVLLHVEDAAGELQPHPIVYDPTTGRLHWGGIRFFPPSEQAANGLYNYQAPRMVLQVREPGELQATEELEGQIVVEVPRLLSGLQVRYFDAMGTSQPVPVESKSKLVMALTLDLQDCFARRRFSPYHYLQFPGVQLNQMRLGDIVSLLESMQFTIASQPVEVFAEERGPYQASSREYLMAATRAEGASQLWLWLRVSERAIRGEWLHETGDNDHQGIHLQGNGDMTIALRSELDGANRPPVQVLNQLHDRLKRRFRFERAVT